MDKVLVFVDLDGTLLKDDKSIAEENLDIIREAYNKYNVEIAIATARNATIAEGFAAELGSVCQYVICANGTTVKHMESDEYIHDKSFSTEKITELIDFCQQNNLGFMAGADKARYFPTGYEYIRDLDRFMSDKFPNSIQFVPDVNSYALDPNNKLILSAIIGEEEELLKHYEELKKISGISVARLSHFSTSGEYINASYFDVMGENVDKGTAMKVAAEHSGSSITVAFGDGNNDIEMLSTADYGFAMRNADPVLMEAAKIATINTNNESGVGKSLLSLLEYISERGILDINKFKNRGVDTYDER